MTSETSSAMLDLNDADTEDTEAPSVTDDARDGVPLIMEHGYDIAVKVDAPMKQLSTLETFVTYRVRCVCARWATPPCVRRRYNHFKLLHKRLSSHQWVAAPPLPPLHTARQQLDRYSASFVAIRTRALHAFLDRVAKHPIFTHSEDFRLFVTTPDEEFDKVFKNENSALNLWGLGSAIYGSGENKPASNGARVKDPEWTSYADYLTSLQQKLTALCSLTTKLQKGTVAVTNEMMNLKRACDVWSSQARGASARAAAALGAGAGAAGAAGGAARHPRAAHAHRALLPLLAAYTAAHVDKIRQRDQLHAAYVSGANATGETHNKLEQCSEALRSELSDWLPKTRSEIKSLLLDVADSQVSLHTQMYMGWERALRLSQDANVEELFKTVSKNAVQNLSPSRCRAELTPTETERDFDELENCSNDSDSIESRTNERERVNEKERVNERSGSEKNEWVDVLEDPVRNEKDSGSTSYSNRNYVSISNENDKDLGVPVSNSHKNVKELDVSVSNSHKNEEDLDLSVTNSHKNGIELDVSGSNSHKSEKVYEVSVSDSHKNEKEFVDVPISNSHKNEQDIDVTISDSHKNEKGSDVSIFSSNRDEMLIVDNVMKSQEKEDFLNEILDDAASGSTVIGSNSDQSGRGVVSDPLKEFSDVDLS